MKSFIFYSIIGTCLVSSSVFAAPRSRGGECSYSPLQEFIRSVRNESEIKQLVDKNVDLNVKPKCGGSIMQLAIRRGNPQVVKVLLENNIDIDTPVSLDGFAIAGAPKEIPLLMFAGYYSPRPEIISLLMQAGAKVSSVDSNGENVLWYMKQNPVLRETDIYDEVNAILLYQGSQKASEGPVESAVSKTASTASARPSAAKRGAPQEIVEPDMIVENNEEKMKKSDF